MKDKTDLDNLNNRLYNSIKDLSEIQDEKRELERSPEENAPRILELKYLEEAKFDEINQIREDKAELEPKLESSLGDKFHDFGQGMKEKAGEIGTGIKDFYDSAKDFFSDKDNQRNLLEAGMSVVTLFNNDVIDDRLKNGQEEVNAPQMQQETFVENAKGNNYLSTEEMEQWKKIKEESEVNEKVETINTANELGKEDGSKIPANDNTPPEHSPDGDGSKKNKEEENNNSNEVTNKIPANDNERPANDNVNLDTLLKEYEKDYNKENFKTDSPEQAGEKATDNLLEKLEKQRDPNSENGKEADDGQSKEDKVKSLLQEQYGEKGVEKFDNIKEKEREEQRQPEKQNTQEQEQSR